MNEIVEDNFRHIRNLARDIESILDGNSVAQQRLGNELAGMFAVTIAATYEGIVKETLILYASNFHSKYKNHVEKDFERLNARISIDDLKSYSRHFGLNEWHGTGSQKNATTFHRVLFETKSVVERRFRRDLLTSYKNVFMWRNAYAHERSASVTFKDVYEAHRVAQYVIRSFVKAFEIG
ncbi:MAG: hypothetical protein KA312_03765 [Sphingorhabdus sp.]|nr:hypothetical protein [Sphingorhabdus sp.]